MIIHYRCNLESPTLSTQLKVIDRKNRLKCFIIINIYAQLRFLIDNENIISFALIQRN